MFIMMHQEGFLPDRFSSLGLLRTCNGSDDLRRGKFCIAKQYTREGIFFSTSNFSKENWTITVSLEWM